MYELPALVKVKPVKVTRPLVLATADLLESITLAAAASE